MEEDMKKLRLNGSTISTKFEFTTDFDADSVEWCPHVPFNNFFVCGTYRLNDDTRNDGKKRLGNIHLFSITLQNGLKLLQTLNTTAVLDQKWCHNQIDGLSILGVVNAQNSIEVYKLNPVSCCLEFVTCYKLECTETLLLSLDWSTGKFASNMPNIACSDSKGNIHKLQFINNKLILDNSWHAHTYEAWITAYYYWDINIILTGGDDSILLKFDTRLGSIPVFKNRTHEAGVTCIHSNAEHEYLIATGSYDTYVRLWDIRNMKTVINSLQLPGTLWRLKWDPHTFQHLLAACMWGGVHIINGLGNENIKIVESYYQHQNIVYGADWSYLNEQQIRQLGIETNRIIGSCSFYDRLLCVSKLSLP